MLAKDVQIALKNAAREEKIEGMKRFFKTGPGQYAEGDQFIGVTVPAIRNAIKPYRTLAQSELKILLTSVIHEERMAALLILVAQYPKAPKEVFDFYLLHAKHINNWDLVDCSASQISGAFAFENGSDVLFSLAKSDDLWERRIAIVSTWHAIKKKSYITPLAIIESLLSDPHDLIQKAVGWMLREIGKRDRAVLIDFLKKFAPKMARTSLRYSIEHLPQNQRNFYLTKR